MIFGISSFSSLLFIVGKESAGFRQREPLQTAFPVQSDDNEQYSFKSTEKVFSKFKNYYYSCNQST